MTYLRVLHNMAILSQTVVYNYLDLRFALTACRLTPCPASFTCIRIPIIPS